MSSLSVLACLSLLAFTAALARLAGAYVARYSVPAIVLELVAGFALGNLLVPFSALKGVAGVTELGVVTLFFLLGLETRPEIFRARRADILRTVGISSLAPLLFYLPLRSLAGGDDGKALLFLAVVTATGTGVTMRALSNLGALESPSARLLVGVSALDDLPAVGLLAASAAVSGKGGAVGHPPLWIAVALAASVFLYGAAARLERLRGGVELGVFPSVALVIGSAWLGEVAGLTSLLGALMGGMIAVRLAGGGERVRENLRVLSEVFVPMYFVTVGMRVEASTLTSPGAWGLACAFVAVGVICKLLCYFGIGAGARAEGVDPWTVVFGLLPRGLPGLVFASGALASGIIDAREFSALVIMVAVTTVVGLLLLGRRLRFTGQLARSATIDEAQELTP